jgi:hypothetical protein
MEAYTKKCTRCLIEKSLDSFAKRSASADGLMYTCRDCNKKYQRDNSEAIRAKKKEYYDANRDSILEDKSKYYIEKSDSIKSKRKNYYHQNKDKCAEQMKSYREANPEKIKQLQKDYIDKNREEIRKKRSAYQKTNIELFNAHSAKRRAYKLKATVGWTDDAIIKSLYAAAKTISENTGILHHVDHVVPLKSKYVCGLHVPCNLQIIPASENLSKRNSYWPDMW